jgi:hypothetical protein
MLVTDSFVFLHIPKTGGSFVQKMLIDFLPVEGRDRYTHVNHDDPPDDWRRLPAVCVVRNPWDWYVSWFHYGIERPRKPGREWLEVMDGGFANAVRRACRGEMDHVLAPYIKREGVDVESAYIRTIAGRMLDRPDLTVLRFEYLVPQLLQFLKEHSKLSHELERALYLEPPIRTSTHGPYRDYYDNDLADLVGKYASWLCQRIDYSFGD